MPSKRTYKDKVCNNPACKIKFIPHDRRQKYCTRQCAINCNNDKAHMQNKERYFREKLVRDCDNKLEMLIDSDFHKNEKIDEIILTGFKIDLRIGSLEQNYDTRRPIFWFHQHGVELIDNSKRIYTIHTRKF